MRITRGGKVFFAAFGWIMVLFVFLFFLFLTGGSCCKPDIVDYIWLMVRGAWFILLEAVWGLYLIAIIIYLFLSKIRKDSLISWPLLGASMILGCCGWLMAKTTVCTFPRCPDGCQFDMIDTWQAVLGDFWLNVIEVIVLGGIILFGLNFLAEGFAWLVTKLKQLIGRA